MRLPTLRESRRRRGRTAAARCAIATILCGGVLSVAVSPVVRRYPAADLTALAARLDDPTRYAAPAGGGLFEGRSPAGWKCSHGCRTICPGAGHSSPAVVDERLGKVRMVRLVVNDYDPALTAADLDKITADEIVIKVGECLGT